MKSAILGVGLAAGAPYLKAQSGEVFTLSNEFVNLQVSTSAPRLLSLTGDAGGQGKWSSANVLVNGGLALELEDPCSLTPTRFQMLPCAPVMYDCCSWSCIQQHRRFLPDCRA